MKLCVVMTNYELQLVAEKWLIRIQQKRSQNGKIVQQSKRNGLEIIRFNSNLDMLSKNI